MFCICEKLGVAFEANGDGLAKFDAASDDFVRSFTNSEREVLRKSPWIRCSENEARAYALSKIEESAASS